MSDNPKPVPTIHDFFAASLLNARFPMGDEIITTCATCAHANHDDGPDDATTVCTNAASWFHGCVMPKVEGCTQWAALEQLSGHSGQFDIGDGPVE